MPAARSIYTTAKRIPWKRVLLIAQQAYVRGSAASKALTPAERKNLVDIAKKSQGRPSNLTDRERARMRELAFKAYNAARYP
jgi:hypothetical protein